MLNKIGNRILIGYSVPLILLILQGLVVSAKSQEIFNLETENYQLQNIAREAGEVSYNISRLIRTLRGVALFPKDKRYREDYNTAYEDFNKSAQVLQNDAVDPQNRDLANTLIAQGRKIHESSQEVFRLADANNSSEAGQSIDSTAARNLESLRQQFNQQIDASVKQHNQKVDADRQFLLIIVWLTTGLAIISTIIVALWISLPLRRQLPKAVASAEQIAEGDLSQTIEVINDQSEIGQLLAAFRNMTKSLNSLISQTQKSGIQITTSTTQIAAAGRQLQATVSEQAASTNQVSATSSEIAATSGELVKTMEDIAKTAQTTALAASHSQADLTQMATAMRQLALATTTISSSLGVMNEKANNINSVVTTITKVADQTNLLSLNAAIEAEKAGEYGAGFAVVAREIRRLADQTAVATLEIEQMVKEMQSSVSTGVMEMDKFNNQVNHHVDLVSQISGEIAQVIDQVQSLTPRVELVSQSMEQQFEGAQQISSAIAQLSESSQQIVQSLQETNRALDQLDDAAQGLQGVICQFKVQS
jgi:methyl-accepting chemotaxis protein WspA